MIAILLAAVIRMVIGWLWYHPALFGKEWMRLAHLNEKELGAATPALLGAFVTALVTAAVLSLFVQAMPPHTLFHGAFIGFLAWLGFVATSSFGGVLFGKMPLKLWLLHRGDDLVSYILMGGVLALL